MAYATYAALIDTHQHLPKQKLRKQYPEEGGSRSTLSEVEKFPQESLFEACDFEGLRGDFDEGDFGDDLLDEGESLAMVVLLM